MKKSTAKNFTTIENLSSILLSTLDEKFFFNEISKYINSKVDSSDRVKVFKVKEDQSSVLISENGKSVKKGLLVKKGAGVIGHVLRTKKSYLSNNVSRDPVFSSDDVKDVVSELCIPIGCDGFVIGTLHIQSFSEEKSFSRDDITNVLEIFSSCEKSIKNMKIYISSQFLNESLTRQIGIQEEEIKKNKNQSSTGFSNDFKVEEIDIIGKSDVMQKVLAVADKVAASSVSVLLLGESGTGKEEIAKRIHCRSSRKDKSFISIDCLSLNEIQLNEELFKDEGYLTSADTNSKTIFINNIELMPMGIQLKLVSFLNKKFSTKSEVAIIATSSKDLFGLAEEGLFRKDLFYILNTISLKVPSLRERGEDIELLASFFLNKNKTIDSQKLLSPRAIESLQNYKWPGNIRELQSVLERAFILSDGLVVEKKHLSESISKIEKNEIADDVTIVDFSEVRLDELERDHICNTLKHLSGNKTRTAKTLGITVKTLYNKLHSYGMIEPKEA